MGSQVEARQQQRGITLPEPGRPEGNYVPAVRAGNLVFLAGVGPRQPNGELVLGKVGRDLTVAQADQAARWCAVRSLANLKAAIGDLDKVVRVVKVLGMVNATPDFTQSPAVINGYSDLLVEVFGDKGRHARSAVGVATLPDGMAVEVEAVVEVAD